MIEVIILLLAVGMHYIRIMSVPLNINSTPALVESVFEVGWKCGKFYLKLMAAGVSSVSGYIWQCASKQLIGNE